MTNCEIIDALKRDGLGRVRGWCGSLASDTEKFDFIGQVVRDVDAAAKMLEPDVLTVKDAGPQSRPREKCPVCGREFLFVGGKEYRSCEGERKSHILYGPSDDPDGRKIDAMVRKMRS